MNIAQSNAIASARDTLQLKIYHFVFLYKFTAEKNETRFYLPHTKH